MNYDLVKDIKPLSPVLGKEMKRFMALKDELEHMWHHKQMFRTETEARMSVLHDAKHATPASKYWQAIREQSAMFNALIELGFEHRKNEVKRLIKERKIEETTDMLLKQKYQISVDECRYRESCIQQTGLDRLRELEMWSKLKKEAVAKDGSFDVNDVNGHQAVSYEMALESRRQSLTPGSSQAEVINVLGPLASVQRMNEKNGITLKGIRVHTDTIQQEVKKILEGSIAKVAAPQIAPPEQRIKLREKLGLKSPASNGSQKR